MTAKTPETRTQENPVTTRTFTIDDLPKTGDTIIDGDLSFVVEQERSDCTRYDEQDGRVGNLYISLSCAARAADQDNEDEAVERIA